MSKIVIAIVGPTAIGKTARAIELANHFNTEIFSADSRQFFKEMNIGTAVPSQKELQAAQHHFIQHISIFDSYSVGEFERDAISKLHSFFNSNDIAILVGGSGLYVDAVLNGLDDFPKVPDSIRESLNKRLELEGITTLQNQLKELDSKYYEQVTLDNPHRLIRALEICLGSGQPYSSFLGVKKKSREFTSILIGLQAERELIYQRINSRVDGMLENGLLEEVKQLHQYKNLNALNTVGYKELFAYLESQNTLEQAAEEIKKNTRRFAKRQLTWFRKNKDILWMDYNLESKEFIAAIEAQIIKRTNGS